MIYLSAFMEKKRVLMLLSNSFAHDPRVYMEAKTLVKNGYSVTVLAWDRKKRERPFEDKDGIKVIRVYNTRFMDILKYDILKLHFWWKMGIKRALELYKESSFDIIHAHDLDTLPIGVALKKKLGLPLIYDAHEIWGYMIARDFPEIISKYYLLREKRLLKYVDRIITVSDNFKKYFQNITDKPIEIIMNAKPLILTEYEPPQNDIFTLIYIGSLNKSRFLIETVEIVRGLKNVRLIIGGIGKKDYVDKLEKECEKSSNVEFIGKVPMDEVLIRTKQADAVLFVLNPENMNNKNSLGNKVFEAMVCGRPVIVSNGTYAGEFVKKENVGIVVDYNKESLKGGIIKLRDNPQLREKLGRNALKAAREKYNWEIQSKKLVRIYEEINKDEK